MSVKREKKTDRSTAGLCDALFEEFDLLRNGDSDAKRATAVAKLTSQIISTKRLEIDAAHLLQGGLNITDVILDGKGMRIGRDRRK
jgi:hypothetical protein